jgi:Fuc2NAc and GlcNAc transferase
MSFWYVMPVIAILSLLLTAALRRYALHRSIIDIPNARSSHSVPTPRGGGVAIVIAFLLALVLIGVLNVEPWPILTAYLGAGTLIAVIGFMDDHGHIAARWRLLGHFLAAAWALFWLGGLAPLTVMGVSFNLGWVGGVLAAFYLVWMLNLYNFMDGIDGIASVEAICSCLALALIYWMEGQGNLIWTPLLLAMAVAGFLVWNFPPAKIFMGDAGSGFLGIILGCLSIQAGWANSDYFFAWLIMLGVFVSRAVGSHKPVTVAVILINLIWLLPIAISVGLHYLDGALGLVLAYIPLIALAFKYKAGQLEAQV